MAKPTLDETYWTQDFAVTDGDLNRLYDFQQESGQPQKVADLLLRVVRSKLEKESLQVDAQQRQKSKAAAKRLLQDQTAQVYQKTKDYEVGDRLLVGRTVNGEQRYDVGEVVETETVAAPHCRCIIRLKFSDGTRRGYLAGVDLDHPQAKRQGWKPFRVPADDDAPVEQTADEVLEEYDSVLLSHLLGRLSEDKRFVQWAQFWWLAEALPALPDNTVDKLQNFLLQRGSPASTETLLKAIDLPIDEPHGWALNLALAEHLDNEGTEETPQWTTTLPDHLLRLSDGTLIDLSMPANELWRQHYTLLHAPPPEELVDHPRVLTYNGWWLFDVLLTPIEKDDLRLVRDYLQEAGEALSDTEILEGLFGISSHDDAFRRWRFTLSYRLAQKAQELSVEFVGSGDAWAWALEGDPIEKPDRHRRLRGTETLLSQHIKVDHVANDLAEDDGLLEETEEEQPAGWKPTRQTWEYVLTYYDWDHGHLPYRREARELIPPLQEDQRRAMLQFLAEQVDDEPLTVELRTQSGKTWLQGPGLQDFFAGYLVPGARIWLDRTEEVGLYKIRYRPVEPVKRTLLFFEGDHLRPISREVEIPCDVDESMLLAESRYQDVQALEKLDQVDRRTATKVLAQVFELVGEHDETRNVYSARFEDVFHLLCVMKPYARSTVETILYDRRHPHFSSAGGEPRWFVYDPNAGRVVEGDTESVSRASERAVELATEPASEGVWGKGTDLKDRDQPAQPPETAQPVAETPEAETPIYFIFQQRTVEGSEYADQVGQVYNWRRGIPGSNQIVEGAHFIYYRPGERVFFGAGRVDTIEEYTGDDGRTYYNGHVSDYEPWEPPLPLTRELAEDISFIEPDWLGIGQAGIRKITSEDFDAILNAYRQVQIESVKEPKTWSQATVECTPSGQLMASNLVPKGPLFKGHTSQVDQPVAEQDPDVEKRVYWPETSAPREKPPPNIAEHDDVDEQLEEKDVDTQEAFDTLLKQLRQALSEAQEEGGQAFKESRFDDAQAAAKRGEEIKSRIEKLKELQRGWSTLIHDSDLTTPQVERIPRGVKTPQQDFWLPILTALEQMGGSGRTREVIDRVEPIVKDRLHEVDWATLSDGRSIRWRNTTQWARYKMVQAGLLASDSPHGVWEITEAGRAYLREHRQKSANSQDFSFR